MCRPARGHLPRSHVIDYALGEDLVRPQVELDARRRRAPFAGLLSSPRPPSGPHWRGDGVVSLRGVGDRWMAGERLPGVEFALRDAVELTAGPNAGARGSVLLLLAITPEPAYLVGLATGGDARVRQSSLRAVV